MAEKDPKKGKKKTLFADKITQDERVKKAKKFIWERWIECVSGALLLIGIIVAFFHIHIGGALAGLGVGLCFYDEIQSYFVQLRNYYSAEGLFKTLMVIGTALYLLIAAPAFLILTAIGMGVMALLRLGLKK